MLGKSYWLRKFVDGVDTGFKMQLVDLGLPLHRVCQLADAPSAEVGSGQQLAIQLVFPLPSRAAEWCATGTPWVACSGIL